VRFLPAFISNYFIKDASLLHLCNVIGFMPGNKHLYNIALTHRSSLSADPSLNNERLEYLGDAVLGAIVGEYLYKKYPTQTEGFLTDMRSKIVNRSTLNDIAIKLGLKLLVKYNKSELFLKNSQIFGNALEALIGAIYIDKGYNVTKHFIQQKIVTIYINMDALEAEEGNQKNKLIGWANKNRKQIEFTFIEQRLEGRKRIFEVGVLLDNEMVITATAGTKKEASKRAATLALEMLGVEV
jgi:ribonuclease III